jgi:hypothetical protein
LPVALELILLPLAEIESWPWKAEPFCSWLHLSARFLLISKDLAPAPLCLLQRLGQQAPTLQQGLLVRGSKAQGRENFVRFRFMASVWHGSFPFQALPVELPDFTRVPD